MEVKVKMTSAAVERVEKKPWPFKPVKVEVTPDLVKCYFENTPAALNDLLDYLLLKSPEDLETVIDRDREDFNEFIRGSL